jgi:GTPase SAR1 family protein
MRIVIFGAGGIGKSTLAQLLSGKRDEMSLLPTYQESITTETYKLENNTLAVILVAPGQKRREDTWVELLRELTAGKFNLVIHVVAGGYHSFSGGIPYQLHEFYQSGMALEEFVIKYVEEQKKREIEVLKKLIPPLAITKSQKIAMLTIVTKQDLWWPQRREIQSHYEQGEYAQLIHQVTQEKGKQNFIHEYASASLVIENFNSGAKELLVTNTAGYDQPLRLVNFKNMLHRIEALSGINLGG